MKKFEAGKSYIMTSILDHQFSKVYTVIKRTAQTVTISDGETVSRCRIDQKGAERFGYEFVYPYGKHSMCPILTAE